MNNYDIETQEYLNYGIKLFQYNLFGETELEHAHVYNGICAPNGLILDLGCGIGEMGYLISQLVPNTHTINVTNSIVQCEYMTKMRRTNVLADYHKTELPSSIADTVMFNESFGYGDIEILLKETSRLLKHKGQLILKDFSHAKPYLHNGYFKSWEYTVHQTSKLITVAEQNSLRLEFIVCPTVQVTRSDFFLNSKLGEWHSWEEEKDFIISNYTPMLCKFIKV